MEQQRTHRHADRDTGAAARAARTASGSAASTRCASASCGASATASPGCGSSLGDASGTAEAVCLGGRRGALRARRAGHAGLRQRRLRDERALGGEDQARRAARGRAATSTRPTISRAESEVSLERLESDLRELLATIQDPQLRELLDRFFGEGSETWARFRDAPAAKIYHQAYRHGLLEHTLSVAQAVSAAANFFPGIDRDVAVTGALLHDIGKTEAYNDDPLAIDLTDAGRLQGEIPLGYYTGAPRDRGDPRLRPRASPRRVLHIILSHHGSLEHGSPVVPATREAVLVHMIDNLGGRLGSFDRLERQLPAGESWSGFDRALSGSAYFGQRAPPERLRAREALACSAHPCTLPVARWTQRSSFSGLAARAVCVWLERAAGSGAGPGG